MLTSKTLTDSDMSAWKSPFRTDEELLRAINKDMSSFWEIFERYYVSLYRYYAIHTGGDLDEAVEMTADTFLVMLRRRATLGKNSFASWLFETAWDVLNNRQHHADVTKLKTDTRRAQTFKVHKLGPKHAEMRSLIKALRLIFFYPRETLYLRIFARLNTRDIGILMDRDEPGVRLLLYQGLISFASQLDGAGNPDLSRGELLHSANAYDLYLEDVLIGRTPNHSMSAVVIRATNRLRELYEVLSPSSKTRADIIASFKQSLPTGGSARVRL